MSFEKTSLSSSMSPDEYLEKSGLTKAIQQVLMELKECQPSHPIEYMTACFRDILYPSTSFSKTTYRQIQSSSSCRSVFMDNLVKAYMSMQGSCNSMKEYTSLLQSLCQDFPLSQIETIVQVFQGSTKDSTITFSQFVAGVRACLLYKEFLEQTQLLFQVLDPSKTGFVDSIVFLKLIKKTLKNSSETKSNFLQTNVPSFYEDQLLSSSTSLLKTRSNDTLNTSCKIHSSQNSHLHCSCVGCINEIPDTKELIRFVEFCMEKEQFKKQLSFLEFINCVFQLVFVNYDKNE